MKKVLFSFILVLCAIVANAQELELVSFKVLDRDISARTNQRLDLNDTPCALVKVRMAAEGVTFAPNVIGDVAFKANEYWVYLLNGARKMTVTHPDFLPMDIVFADHGIKRVESNKTYELVIEVPQLGGPEDRNVHFYGEGGAHMDMGAGMSWYASLGTFIKKFNIEAGYTAMSPKEMPTLYLYDKKTSKHAGQFAAPSTAHSFALKIGYRIPMGKSWVLTPQVGVKHITMSNDADGSELDITPNATSATVGGRLALRLGRTFDIVLTPEYSFKMRGNSSFDYFEKEAPCGDDFKALASHLSIRLGVALKF